MADLTALKAVKAVENGRYYSVLCALKPLFNIEQELLTHNPTIGMEEKSIRTMAAAS